MLYIILNLIVSADHSSDYCSRLKDIFNCDCLLLIARQPVACKARYCFTISVCPSVRLFVRPVPALCLNKCT